ncbi:MAG: hypothetical protein QXH37_02090 [Candidatus Bathyarchaeia archaeon]
MPIKIKSIIRIDTPATSNGVKYREAIEKLLITNEKSRNSTDATVKNAIRRISTFLI